MGKNIVVLGGGIGGIVAANVLRKKLGNEHKVTVIDKYSKHSFKPSYLWVVAGKRKPEEVEKDIALLKKKGIVFMNSEIKSIDVSKKIIVCENCSIMYDYLVISLGADLDYAQIKGFKESAISFYDLEGAVKLRDALNSFSGGKVAILISRVPFKCPAAPYECSMILENYFRKRGIRDNVELSIYTAEPQPMPVAGPAIGEAVKGILSGKKINFYPNYKVTGIDAEKKVISFENRETAKFDLLVGIPPHKVPDVLVKSGLTDESSWISVDKNTLKTKFDNVYAIGDNAAIKLASGAMLPKAGVFAHFEAETVAENIASEISGKPAIKKFEAKGVPCFLETGDGKAGFNKGNFYAEPKPVVKFSKPSVLWYWSKVLFEKYWMRKWF